MAKTKPTKTPIQKQWEQLKKKHPDAVLLFRCGDFYESYNEDAVTIAEVLGITLTKRMNSPEKMAGFPFHNLDTYLPKLIRAGKRVSICDNLEPPKTIKKNEATEEIINNNNNTQTTTTMEEKKEIKGLMPLCVLSTGKHYINQFGDDNYTMERIIGWVYGTDGKLYYKVEAENADGFVYVKDGFNAYPNVDRFKDCDPSGTESMEGKLVYFHDGAGDCVRINVDENGMYVFGYVFENGEAKSKKLPVLRLAYNGKRIIVTTPEQRVYTSRMECLGYNKVNFTDEEGNTREEGGWIADTTLTDEQRAAYEEFKAAVKKLEDLGVQFVEDTCEQALCVYNSNKYQFTYDDATDYEAEACELAYKYAEAVRLPIDYYQSDDIRYYKLKEVK